MLLLVELFYSFLWLTLHCLYVPHLLYPFICQWTFKLLPCLSHCKQWHSEHQDTWILSNHVFLWMFVQDWDYWIIHELFLGFFRSLHPVHSGCTNLHSHSIGGFFFFSICSPAFIICRLILMMALVAQTINNLPVMQETCVRSLGCKDPLEKETATHSSILAWRCPWTV